MPRSAAWPSNTIQSGTRNDVRRARSSGPGEAAIELALPRCLQRRNATRRYSAILVFRAQCREALKGNNQALRRVIDLMLTLGQEGRNKIEIQENEGRDSLRELMEMARRHRGNFDGAPEEPSPGPKEPSPRMKEFENRADAFEKEERQRLMREARLSQHRGFLISKFAS